MTRTMDEEMTVMCNLSQGVEARGIAKGVTRGLVIALKSLMNSTGMSREQAMAALEIPENERSKYMRLLEQQ